MHHDDATAAALAVTEFAARLATDPHLAAEMQRARREFFPNGPTMGVTVPGAADSAELRFAEWFTLERESEVLGAVPVDVPAWSGDASELGDSTAGLWLVQNVTSRTVEARDLQGGDSLDLAVPPAALQPGDLIVGRLFAHGAGRWTPSTAAAIFRPGAQIATAFLRDVQRLDLERRLQQVELEHLLLRRPQSPPEAAAAAAPAVPLEHLEADLDRLLERSGTEHTAANLSQQLAIAVRAGQVMGPLLDELAFDSEVDLDRVRELLLAIWNAHHRAEPTPELPVDEPPAAPGESLGERLVRTLDEGLAQKRDLTELFAQLERMAGIEPEPEDDEAADDEPDDEDDDTAERAEPDDAAEGNLPALIEEYLWETGRSEDPKSSLRVFGELQRNAALPHRDLEEITSTDVTRLLLHVYLGAVPADRAARVRATFDELQAFYRWATEVQEMPIGSVLEGCRGALLDQLDRLQGASLALSTDASARSRPGVLEVGEVGPQGFGVRDDDGGDHWLCASPAAVACLRVGDLVVGGMAPAGTGEGQALAGLVVVLPAEARSLME